ncbi:MAG: DNA mismatch repair protein MutS [Spirochaetes bacterium]|nr:DNA mismatch repair protein MutS [Spirochaetota bacterium]
MSGKKTTPMMKQYREIKSKYKDMILFFRLGDFYEMFEDDAREVSALLNLTLTARHGIPMCGIPHHAAKNYLGRMVQAGKKIAICEQVEDPSQAKGIVKRAVTRIITPGTLIDDNLIQSHDNNSLMCIYMDNKKAAVAVCDISTGEFYVLSYTSENNINAFIQDEISRYSPKEIIISGQITGEIKAMLKRFTITEVPEWIFDPELAEKEVKAHFKLISLDVFGLNREDMTASVVNSVLYYLKETQKNILDHIKSVTRIEHNDFVSLSRSTQINLELITNLSGESDYTLFSIINQTLTPMGSRLLKQSILKPLAVVSLIEKRLETVDCFVMDKRFHSKFREQLTMIKDIERLISRVSMARANARDLIALSKSLFHVNEVRMMLLEKEAFLDYRKNIKNFNEIIKKIDDAVKEEPSVKINEGNIFKDGYSKDLDELRSVSKSGKDWIADFQLKERSETGISSLKVKYNRIAGYFIEVTKSNIHLVPDSYQRKQTLVNAERFITEELKKHEEKVLSAHERIIALEEKLFIELRDWVAGYYNPVIETARTISYLDMFASFAYTAIDLNYVRPSVNDSGVINIVDGRHPVVESVSDERFVPNNTYLDLDADRIMIVTGPNMAGKSTFLRQTALITLMAQIGSYVPAEKAEIGIVDKIFTRVGANDNLAMGQSTFLVEMIEAASILNNATSRSLIIMDELGRGTSTYDGLSIAWSVIEYLLKNPEKGGRTLFATHYHELTVLEDEHGIKNLNVQVKEWNDEVIFLKKVLPGCADQSYGIHVARLAGLPIDVIERPKVILGELEDKSDELGHARINEFTDETKVQLQLFKPYEEDILHRIRQVDINSFSPLDALNLLAEFKDKL